MNVAMNATNETPPHEPADLRPSSQRRKRRHRRGWPKSLRRPKLGAMLDPKELERYARHIVLREVGGPGQAKLKARARAGGRRRRPRRAGAALSGRRRGRHARA